MATDGDFYLAIDTAGNSMSHNLRVPIVSVRVWQVAREQTLQRITEPLEKVADYVYARESAPSKPDNRKPSATYDTVIELVTQGAVSDLEQAAPDVASACFERSLRALNRLLLAYAVSEHDAEFAFASPKSLDPFAFLATRPLDGPFDRGPVLYWLSFHNIPDAKVFLDPVAMERFNRFLRVVTLGNPFLQPLRLSLYMRRAHREDDTAGVLMAAASAGELLLNTLLRLMLVEEGRADKYEELIRTRGLKTRLKREYAARLGGSWDLDNAVAQVGNWWLRVQVVRGRVLHAGYWPKHVEADAALAAGEALERFLDERLAGVCGRYPLTALSKLGGEGLRKRGVPQRFVAPMVAENDPKLPEFWRVAGGSIDLRQPD